jgi:hypothetical protein
MVFAHEMNDPVLRLTKRLDEGTRKHQAKGLGSYVVLLCDSKEREEKLKALAKTEKIQHTTLALLADDGVSHSVGQGSNGVYRLQRKLGTEAEVTVVLASELRVRASYAYRMGDLKDKDIDQILADLPKILPK